MEKCYVWEYGERERERPGTKHNTIKGKIKQFLKERIISKVIGGGGGGVGRSMKKKIFTQEKIADEMKGILTQKKKQQQRAG